MGESARLSPGAEVDLKKVPLKYQGLDPWQIWVSESQERMTVSVRPADKEAFLALAEKHNVEATVIGGFGGDGKLKLTYGGETCLLCGCGVFGKGLPPMGVRGPLAAARGPGPGRAGAESAPGPGRHAPGLGGRTQPVQPLLDQTASSTTRCRAPR